MGSAREKIKKKQEKKQKRNVSLSKVANFYLCKKE